MEPTPKQPLYELLHHPQVWRAREHQAQTRTIPTGHAGLDRHLPGGGWPADALSEVLLARRGQGELRLLMPALTALCRQDDGRCLVWVAPPWVPYAPALAAAGLDLARLVIVHADDEAEILWAVEQSLRSGSCAAVLGWSERATVPVLRRLQLAAAEGGTPGVLFRPAAVADQSSPAALRLLLEQVPDGFRVTIAKSRGGRPVSVSLPLGAALTRRTRD